MSMRVEYNKADDIRPIKIWGDCDENTLEQTKNVAELPFVHPWVVLCPDNHFGYGVPIGSVVPAQGYVMPYAVGSDIGCGMSAIPLGISASDFSSPDTVRMLFEKLQGVIPVGEARHGLHDLDGHAYSHRYAVSMLINNKLVNSNSYEGLTKIMRNTPFEDILVQMGTLGGGNHFFELQKDQDDMLWFMIHSGSRNLGDKVCKLHLGIAQDLCGKYHSNLPDKYLAYLPTDTQEGQNYIEQMNIALEYAFLNREEMMRQALNVLEESFGYEVDIKNLINIHHNFARLENHYGKNLWVHRKGATSARKGETVIIPGSMCTKSIIGVGKGFKDSLMSCSHGAGRVCSRKESKRRIEDGLDASVEDQLGDVQVFGSDDVSDELGTSYKDVESVMQHQSDMVDITHELTPIAVLKG